MIWDVSKFDDFECLLAELLNEILNQYGMKFHVNTTHWCAGRPAIDGYICGSKYIEIFTAPGAAIEYDECHGGHEWFREPANVGRFYSLIEPDSIEDMICDIVVFDDCFIKDIQKDWRSPPRLSIMIG